VSTRCHSGFLIVLSFLVPWLVLELPSSPGEDEPAIESGGPAFTAAAGFHSGRKSHA
jgi:hypothetical protein